MLIDYGADYENKRVLEAAFINGNIQFLKYINENKKNIIRKTEHLLQTTVLLNKNTEIIDYYLTNNLSKNAIHNLFLIAGNEGKIDLIEKLVQEKKQNPKKLLHIENKKTKDWVSNYLKIKSYYSQTQKQIKNKPIKSKKIINKI
jgi:hypothetical protein